MKPDRWMLVIGTLLIIGLASIAVAQMMRGDHHHSVMNKPESTPSGGMMMNQAMLTNLNGMMSDMSKNYNMMSNDFNKLESDFKKMMQMQDMKALKAEMQTHYDMMNQMHASMVKQQGMWQNMMSMMNSAGMNGMMKADSTEPESSSQHAYMQ